MSLKLIKCNLDLQPCSWWLRSFDILLDDRDPHQYPGYVDFFNHLNSIFSSCSIGILPVCAI